MSAWRIVGVLLGTFGIFQTGIMAATSIEKSHTTGSYEEVVIAHSSKGYGNAYALHYAYEAGGRTYHATAGAFSPRPNVKSGEITIVYSPLFPWFSYPEGMGREKLAVGLISLAIALFIFNAKRFGLDL